MIALLQWLNEAILRPTAVVLDIAMRVVRVLYGGFRAVAIVLGTNLSVSSIISGFIVAGLLLALLWLGAKAVRKFRLKSPSRNALFAGTVLFWLGCAIGVYFLAVTIYALAQPNIPSEVMGYLVGTVILYPAAGRLIRYVLGR